MRTVEDAQRCIQELNGTVSYFYLNFLNLTYANGII